MNTSALIMMIIVEAIIAVLTARFFYLVLTIKPKPEPDSYSNNNKRNNKK